MTIGIALIMAGAAVIALTGGPWRLAGFVLVVAGLLPILDLYAPARSDER